MRNARACNVEHTVLGITYNVSYVTQNNGKISDGIN